MGVIQRQSILNSIISFAGLFLGALNTVFVFPLFLSKEELGLTRLLFSYSTLLATFVPLGVNNILLKYFPSFRNREKQHHGIFGLAIGLTLLGFVLACLMLLIFKPFITAQYNRQSPLFNEFFYFIFPLTFFIALSSVFFTYCTSLFKTSFPSFLNDVLLRLLAIALFGIYYLKWISLEQMIWMYVLKFGFVTLLNLWYVFKIDKPSIWLDLQFFIQQNPRQIFFYGLLLSLASLSGLGLKYIDMVMLGKYLPLEFVGIYSVAVFIPTIVEAPLLAMNKIGIASIAEAWKRNDIAEVKKIYYRSARYLFIAGGWLFVCVNLNTHSLFELFPDKGYALGESVILIISMGTVVSMATGINDAIIYTSDKYISATAMLLILFVLAITNNYIFIPLWGMNGAAFATAFSAVVFNLMKYFFILKQFRLQPFDKKTIAILLIVVSCYAIGLQIPSWGHPVWQMIYKTMLVTFLFGLLLKWLNIIPEVEKDFLTWVNKKLDRI